MAEPISTTISSVGLKTIISAGFSFAKERAIAAYDNYFGELVRIDKILGGELQKASRKAQLSATILACESCLAEPSSINKQAIKWLKKLIESFQETIAKLPNQSIKTLIDDNDSLALFQSQPIDEKEHRQKLIKRFKEETLELIQTGTDLSLFNDNGFNLLKEKIETGWEKDTLPHQPVENCDWFELVCKYFQHEYNSNPKLTSEIQKHQQKQIISELNSIVEKLNKIDAIHELAAETYENVKSLLENQNLHSKYTQPVLLSNLPNLDINVFGREEEKGEILNALCGNPDESAKRKFCLVVAPSGFGKTYLLTKVLQDITDGKIIKPEYAEKLQAVILIDCRLTQNIIHIIRDFNVLLGSQLVFDDSADVKQWLNTNLFPLIKQIGTTWVIFDNFEAWLDSRNYQVIDAQINTFLNALFESNHNLQGIFSSQADPERDIKTRLNKLEKVGAELYKGLPEADALNYLRTEGKKVGLDIADDALLKEFLLRVSYIPQALTSLIGYLADTSDYTFSEFMSEKDFWGEFDKEEKDETALGKGIRRTKALIARQIINQSAEIQYLLQALAFFDMPTPREALELLFENKVSASHHISRLTSHNLASKQTDLRGAIFYDLHSYFREQAKSVLGLFQSVVTTTYLDKLREEGFKAYLNLFYEKALALYNCSIKLQGLLMYGGQRIVLIERFYGDLLNRAISLQRLGRVNESLAEFNKITSFLTSSLEKQFEFTLLGLLIVTNINKGEVFRGLDKLSDAEETYLKTIGYLKIAANTNINPLAANQLSSTYVNLGMVYLDMYAKNSDRKTLDKALSIFTSGITVLEDFKKTLSPAEMGLFSGSILLTLSCCHKGKAMAIQGQAILTSDLSLANKAINSYEDALSTLSKLGAVDNNLELMHEKANLLVNKAISYEILTRYEESLSCSGEAIELLSSCVENGLIQELPSIVTTRLNRVIVYKKLKDLKSIANELVETIKLEEYLDYPELSEYHKEKISEAFFVIIKEIYLISEEERSLIYSYTGDFADRIKNYVNEWVSKS